MEEQIDTLLNTLKIIQTEPDSLASPTEKEEINKKREEAVIKLMRQLKNRVDIARSKLQSIDKIKFAIRLAPQLIQKAIIAQSYLPPTLAGSVMEAEIIHYYKLIPGRVQTSTMGQRDINHGDAQLHKCIYEIKYSAGSTQSIFNFKGIRTRHHVHWYILMSYDVSACLPYGELKASLMPASEVYKICLAIGTPNASINRYMCPGCNQDTNQLVQLISMSSLKSQDELLFDENALTLHNQLNIYAGSTSVTNGFIVCELYKQIHSYYTYRRVRNALRNIAEDANVIMVEIRKNILNDALPYPVRVAYAILRKSTNIILILTGRYIRPTTKILSTCARLINIAMKIFLVYNLPDDQVKAGLGEAEFSLTLQYEHACVIDTEGSDNTIVDMFNQLVVVPISTSTAVTTEYDKFEIETRDVATMLLVNNPIYVIGNLNRTESRRRFNSNTCHSLDSELRPGETLNKESYRGRKSIKDDKTLINEALVQSQTDAFRTEITTKLSQIVGNFIQFQLALAKNEVEIEKLKSRGADPRALIQRGDTLKLEIENLKKMPAYKNITVSNRKYMDKQLRLASIEIDRKKDKAIEDIKTTGRASEINIDDLQRDVETVVAKGRIPDVSFTVEDLEKIKKDWEPDKDDGDVIEDIPMADGTEIKEATHIANQDTTLYDYGMMGVGDGFQVDTTETPIEQRRFDPLDNPPQFGSRASPGFAPIQRRVRVLPPVRPPSSLISESSGFFDNVDLPDYGDVRPSKRRRPDSGRLR